MKKIRVLFVCLGNICRSPMAESVMLHKIRTMGLEEHFVIDSAGTGEWHVGHPPDPRTIAELAKHGIPWASRARQLRSEDFVDFDHVVAMDHSNVTNLKRWPRADASKVSLLRSWHPEADGDEVPDPYYGGPEGFAEIHAMIDQATSAMIRDLLAARERPSV